VQTRKRYPDIIHEAVQEALDPPQNTENIKAGATRAVEVEKVIVLSFRGLQLRRIAALQDDLLRLAMTSIHFPTANISNVTEFNASPSTTNAAPVSLRANTKTIYDALSAYSTVYLETFHSLADNM
jgi:hypothetical protein